MFSLPDEKDVYIYWDNVVPFIHFRLILRNFHVVFLHFQILCLFVSTI